MSELIKFNKVIILNEWSFEHLLKVLQILLYHMQETNKNLKMTTQFFRFNLVDSILYRGAKELRFEWESIKNE